jgi:hypothetical protein
MGGVGDEIEFDVGCVLEVLAVQFLAWLAAVSLITAFSDLHILFFCQRVLVE